MVCAVVVVVVNVVVVVVIGVDKERNKILKGFLNVTYQVKFSYKKNCCIPTI